MGSMKIRFVIFFSILTNVFVSNVQGDANGGTDCAACVLIIGLVEQVSQVHATDIVTAADMLCSYLPSPLSTACDALLDEFGPSLIDMVYHKETPDLICHDIGFCTQDPGKDYCHLFPMPPKYRSGPTRPMSSSFSSRKILPNYYRLPQQKLKICDIPEVKEICEEISRFSNDHEPIEDEDDDKFSQDVGVLRGFMWRGRDCNDRKADHYPGRNPLNKDKTEDSNCNGIYGVDPSSGTPFEDLYCNKTQQRGIIILGDSAGAHFRIPQQYLTAATLSEKTFEDILVLLANEGDWPMLSSTTAYSTTNYWPTSVQGPIDSLYLRLRDHNLCNHRDYQNIGVNGARSSSMNDIVKSIGKTQTLDKPAIVMLALIGNDVCNGHVDTINHMTTPTEFRTNTMVTLKYLDTVLPNGSSVIISGLADGRVLWDLLSKRYHPIGQLNKDVTYQNLYDYLNCLEVSPCTGWMNSNATLRNFTSERAANLSAVALNITQKEKFKNFKLYYIDFDIHTIIDMWKSQGGEAWEIIEPVDGFHPGQISQALTAEYIWNQFKTKHPEIIGSPNPNNNKIKTTFGDQGGH